MEFFKVKRFVFILMILGMVSCNFFQRQEEKKIVARVGSNYLYEDELKAVLSGNLSAQDSINLARNYIDTWATKQLLTDKAIINLNEEKLRELEGLIREYRTDLYINAYQEALVSRSMDTTVSPQEIEAFYRENNENFRVNEELLQFRYLHLLPGNSSLEDITKRFKRFNEEDKHILDSLSLQYKNYSLNDSIWIKISQVVEKVPVITSENKEEYLKKSQFFKIEDSLGVYLIYINDVAKTYDIAPLAYIQPTVKRIILNKRKLEFVEKLEKDILNDAIQKKQFEIYK